MDDFDRLSIREQVKWNKLRRLGVKYVICAGCNETDPVCFVGELVGAKRNGQTLNATCERCKRILSAPTDQKSIAEKWAALRRAGVTNERCLCGADNPFAFEADHLAGRKSSDDVVGICINCHLKRTARQFTEYLPDNLNSTNPIIIERNRLRGTIEHLELAVANLRTIEDFLHNMAYADFQHMQE